ncbi:MAG TPA: hypothetical protein PK006_12070 [Saprospiraceae bacterium]|nr:hypothetical protein [Saprospiraceae bacterium]
MPSYAIFLLVFFSLLVIASIWFAYHYGAKAKSELNQTLLDKEQMKIQFDGLRKEKIELEDKFQQLNAQEKTFRVAYEDWKSKYEYLDSRYLQLKKDYETLLSEKSKWEEFKMGPSKGIEAPIKTSSNSAVPELSQGSKSGESQTVLLELKSILDQHLQILTKVMNEGNKSAEIPASIPSDPLHWIMGIDEEINNKLNKQGIYTFHQVSELGKKDLRNLMNQFDEIDSTTIESWPFQAKAILNSKQA